MPAPRKTRSTTKRAAPKGAAQAVLTDALAEAAWAEADKALAQAMAELDQVEAARDPVSRADALMMLRQALARAARVRGFARLGAEPGEIEPYDERRHELTRESAKPPEDVMIVWQGVARGGEVLVKARAKALRKRAS